MKKKGTLVGLAASLALALALATASASAGDGPLAQGSGTEKDARGWSGFYVGGHFAQGWGQANWTAFNSAGAAAAKGTLDFYRPYDGFKGTGSYLLGLQAGYNVTLPAGIVLGAETDISFPSTFEGERTFTSPSSGLVSYAEKVDYSGTIRGRLGHMFGSALLYGTAGLAWTYDQYTRSQLAGTPPGGTAVPGTTEMTSPRLRVGWAAGAGVEWPLAGNWTANFQYLFTDFSAQSVRFPAGAQQIASDLTSQSVRLGINYQIDRQSGDQAEPKKKTAGAENWAIHGQSTFVYQYAAPFHAPYAGTNSLVANQARETWDVTFYLGTRLWQGAELWVNPEIDQGFGLSGTLGVAGFTSGEAYKIGNKEPYARLPRMFVRQTIGLGGETETIDAGINQLAGTQSKDRLVITAGKFSSTDIFDTNKYAHDPRVDFLNWTIVDTGTFDYAADAWAFTYGAAAEWYQGPWTLRAGFFDLPIVPNSTDLDPHFAQHQWIAELERRYELAGQPGKLALTSFLSQGRMARFEDAVRLASMAGQPADLAAARRFRSRGGFSVNIEQQISKDVGIFARAGLADGNLEPFAFTDADRTLAAGIVVTGSAWGRPKDTFGIAGIVNGISRVHESYLNAGGLTPLLGDGKLPNPGTENILETYYSLPVGFVRLTGDYQLVVSPGYNTDRGPVSVFAVRLRSEF